MRLLSTRTMLMRLLSKRTIVRTITMQMRPQSKRTIENSTCTMANELISTRTMANDVAKHKNNGRR